MISASATLRPPAMIQEHCDHAGLAGGAIQSRRPNQRHCAFGSRMGQHSPDPGSRVSRAARNAAVTGSTATTRSREPFSLHWTAYYGDDPRQGIIEGTRFRHSDLRPAFTAPSGFGMENAANSVSVTGLGSQAQFSGAAYPGDRASYIDAVFAKLGGGGSVPAGDASYYRQRIACRLADDPRPHSVEPGRCEVFACDFGGVAGDRPLRPAGLVHPAPVRSGWRRHQAAPCQRYHREARHHDPVAQPANGLSRLSA